MTHTISMARNTARLMAVFALSVSMLAPPARAANEQELEARLDALAGQVRQLQAELSALRAQRSEPGAAEAQPAPVVGAAPPPLSVGTLAERPKLDWSGYGELGYLRPAHDEAATTADLGRFVFGASYRFDDRTTFASELEVEHAVSSAEDPGEVEIEQAYIEHRYGDRLFARYGLFLMPVGLLNENHEPTRYYGVFRNLVETAIIPTTWREGGVAFQRTTDNGLRWDAGVTTGFKLANWDPTSTEGLEAPLGSIHQELALASAGDLSVFGAVNYTGIPGLRVGGSVFTGDSAQGQVGFDDNRIALWEGHARWTPGNWEISALAAQGRISNTRTVNLGLVGNPALVPEEFYGRYIEAAYRAGLPRGTTLAPFARYEQVNTASRYAFIGTGLTPASLETETALTAGVNFYIASGVVFKADYVNFRRDDASDRFDIGLGYQF
jgi:hypothetical protein